MKKCKDCNIEKPFSDFNSSKTTKDKCASYCKVCHNIRNKQNYYKNYEKNRNRLRKYYYDNHEIEKENRRKHYHKNKEMYLSNFYLREERIKQATPPWLDSEMKNQITLKYKISKRLKEIHNIDYHVDHIVPICGENVCGLHVPWNLQVITGEENLGKSNKHE